MRNHNIIDISLLKKHQTDKAILVENLKQKDVWIPISQIEIDHEREDGIIDIQIPEWLAEEKELI